MEWLGTLIRGPFCQTCGKALSNSDHPEERVTTPKSYTNSHESCAVHGTINAVLNRIYIQISGRWKKMVDISGYFTDILFIFLFFRYFIDISPNFLLLNK